MKSLQQKFFEELSDNNIEELKKYITNDNFNEYIDIISKHAKNAGIDTSQYDAFFEKHGLTKLNWGRKNSANKQFTKLFVENDHLEILTEIVKNDGVISINSNKFTENGNIFDYCKINGHDFTDEAHTIATWTNSGSANAGPCELLLKFILIEGATLASGDVGIKYSSTEEEMEVKAATTGKNASGGHAAGQKGNNGDKIRGAWSIYLYLNKNLFNLNNDNSEADKSAYFQNENGIAKFNQLLKDNKLLENNVDLISDNIVDALAFQYNFITNDNFKKSESYNKFENKLKSAAKSYVQSIIGKDGFAKQQLLNLIGCIQLYLYSQVEGFDYFFCVQIDKSDDSTNPNNGNYWCVKKCKNEDSPLLKFNDVIKNLYFGTLDSATSSQGRTGKIFMNKLN